MTTWSIFCFCLLELKNILDILQLETNELQGLKLQHDQKVSDLEKLQVEVLEVRNGAAAASAPAALLCCHGNALLNLTQEKLLLENLQQTAQQQKGETEWQKQLLERDKRAMERLTAEIRALQPCVERLSKEKEELQEKCDSWEKKLAQSKR